MTIVWSNGGGTQSTGLLALIYQGRLPRPDVVVFADTGREKAATWSYLDAVHRPILAELGLELSVCSAAVGEATNSLTLGRRVLIPGYSWRDGRVSKGRAFCSGQWKRDAVRRHLVGLGHTRYSQWLGISIEESDRAVFSPPRAWVQNVYPLIEFGLSRDDCHTNIRRLGWPTPPKSSCWMCPNMGTNEWRHMQRTSPADFRRAVALDAELTAEYGMYLHRSLRPLGSLTLDDMLPLFGEDEVTCDTGGCWT